MSDAIETSLPEALCAECSHPFRMHAGHGTGGCFQGISYGTRGSAESMCQCQRFLATPPTEPPAAEPVVEIPRMTESHVRWMEYVLKLGVEDHRNQTHETLAVVRSLASGDTVLVKRSELEEMIDFAESATNWLGKGAEVSAKDVADKMRRWLTEESST